MRWIVTEVCGTEVPIIIPYPQSATGILLVFPYLISFFQEYPGKSFIGKFTTRFLLNEVKAIFTLYQKLRTTNTFWALFF